MAAQNKPFVTVCFGNPYTATFLPKLPAVLLAYEFSDFTERAAAKAPGRRDPDRREAPGFTAGDVPGRPRADAGGDNSRYS